MRLLSGVLLLAAAPLGAQEQPPAWSFLTASGLRTIATVESAGLAEVVAVHSPATGPGGTWLAFHRSSAGGLVDAGVSAPIATPANAGPVRLLAAEFDAEWDGTELVLVWTSGLVHVFNHPTRVLVRTLQIGLGRPVLGGAVGDLDLDGVPELALLTDSGLHVADAFGADLWGAAGYSTGGLEIGQVDADPELEVVTGDGRVFDGSSGALQFRWRQGLGSTFVLADVDQDGRVEAVYAHGSYRSHLWALDLDTGLPLWSVVNGGLANNDDIGALAVADYDRDGTAEVFTAPDQWGSYHCIDAATQIEEWAVNDPLHGSLSDRLVVFDADGDGVLDLVHATGNVTGTVLQVLAGSTRTLSRGGPPVQTFVPPVRGDVDGDGQDEIVTATRQTGNVSDGTLFVFDAATRTLEQQLTVNQLGFDFRMVTDLALGQLDADPALELVAAADSRVLVYDYVPATGFAQQASPWLTGGAPIRVLVADVDPAPGRELVVLSSGFVHLLAYPSWTELWRSLPTGPDPRALLVADADQDQDLDLLALTNAGVLYVYDAGSRTLLQALQAPAGRALRSVDVPAPGVLLLGDNQGGISASLGNNAFALLGPLPFAPAAVEHLQVLPGLALIGSHAGGNYWIHDGLSPVFRGNLGAPQPNPRFLVDLQQPGLFATGQLGLYLFLPR